MKRKEEMEKLTWTKSIFGSRLTIKQGSENIGNINWDNTLSSKAQAVINGKFFTLTREVFLSKIGVYDGNSQVLLGTVMVNIFNPHSDVLLNGKRFELEIKNFWQSRWSWKYNGKEIITFISHELLSKDKGDIEFDSCCNEEVEILILLGLFVRNQFVLLMILVGIILLVIIV